MFGKVGRAEGEEQQEKNQSTRGGTISLQYLMADTMSAVRSLCAKRIAKNLPCKDEGFFQMNFGCLELPVPQKLELR